MIDLKLAVLMDIYGGLLSEKQFRALDLYYNADYSLLEIAQNCGVSRQGIHENIKQATENLLKFEDELKLYEKSILIEKNVEKIKKLLDGNDKKDEILELIEVITQ